MRMAFGLCRVQSGQCTWKAQLNCLCSICDRNRTRKTQWFLHLHFAVVVCSIAPVPFRIFRMGG